MVKVAGRSVSEKIISKLTTDIKEKRELGTIEESFVHEIVLKELSKDIKFLDWIISHELKTLNRSGKYKNFIRNVRAILRKAYGVFQKGDVKDRWTLLEKLNDSGSLSSMKKIHEELLETHLSTKERLPYYKEFYSNIWRITGHPKVIVDLGCGLNPLSYPFMGLKKIDYYCSELSSADVKFLNAYFDIMERFGLAGKAIQQDLRKLSVWSLMLKSFPKADVCLMLKLFDSLKVTGKSKNIDVKMMENINANWIVVSFPTKTIGARSMKIPKRGWLEKFCARKEWPFERFSIENEVIYVINKYPKK